MTRGVVDEYLADEIDPAGPWTDADVLACALAHSTRVAAYQSGWSVSRVRNLRARHGHNRGRGHPSAAVLEREAPRLTCPCRGCIALRHHEAVRSSYRHANTRPKGLPQLGPWATDAACAEVETAVFFPNSRKNGSADPTDNLQSRQRGAVSYRPEPYARAKAICARCPVIDACRTWSIKNDMRFGVWGGLDWLERDRLLGHLPAEVAP